MKYMVFPVEDVFFFYHLWFLEGCRGSKISIIYSLIFVIRSPVGILNKRLF
uniref:Uncharacterized protein n=1 Tax=Rhizophora mucronata TaxID=61149 RepID=A0A2P2QGC9_RHIMU